MASPSGTSSGSEADLQAIMDQRKRKRMVSNRESARRSRARKQKAMDDLTSKVSQLREQNRSILAALAITRANCCVVQAKNSVLRTQMWELSSRLKSLGEILVLVHGHGSSSQPMDFSLVYPWSSGHASQAIMASADAYQYY